MKLVKLSLCAAVATLALGAAGAASAQTAPTAPVVSFNVGLATDYVFRGIDQTGSPSGQLFGGADMSYGQFYVGTWLSNSGPRGDNGMEYDIYGGWKPTVGPATLDLGLYYYGYNNSRGGNVSSNFNTLELKAGASMPVGSGTIGAVAYYSNNLASSSANSWYEEINGSFPYSKKLSVSGAIGAFQSSAIPKNYITANIGATYMFTDHVSLDVRYIGVSQSAKTSYPGAEFNGGVATVKYVW